MKSWKGSFRGSSADNLHEILKAYTKKPGNEYYARYVSIVQSSGTGKSRMNDELAKDIVYMPVNLSRGDIHTSSRSSLH